MATITIKESHVGSTIVPYLSAHGPNVTRMYDSVVLTTLQPGVTAFVTSYAFQNAYPYHNEEGQIFTLIPGALTGLPLTITNTGVSSVKLSAHVGECAFGPYAGTLALTLSSNALSAAAVSAVPVSVPVATTTQTITFALTAVNKPYHHHLCEKRFKRMRQIGIV